MSVTQLMVKKGSAQNYKDIMGRTGVNEKGETVRLCYPYVVRLPIRMSVLQTSLDHIAEVFLYHNDPSKVAYKACGLWNHWIRIKGKLKVDEYPKIQEFKDLETLAEIVELDDGDYEEIWKAAKKCKHYKAGHPDWPVAFMLPPSSNSAFR